MSKTLLPVLFICISLLAAGKINGHASKRNDNNHKHFVLLSAASEDWVAGTKGGGRGTEYYFTLKITTSTPLSFDSIWVANKALPLFIANTKTSISDKPVRFKKGDTILLRASYLQRGEDTNQSIVASPLKFKGAALLRYYAGVKKVYFIIPQIKKRQTLNRQ